MRNRISEVTQVRQTEERATRGTGGLQESLLSIRLNTGQRKLLGDHQRTKEQSERLEVAVLVLREWGIVPVTATRLEILIKSQGIE